MNKFTTNFLTHEHIINPNVYKQLSIFQIKTNVNGIERETYAGQINRIIRGNNSQYLRRNLDEQIQGIPLPSGSSTVVYSKRE